MNPLIHTRVAAQWLQASSHRKSVALMKFLSGVARRLGVGDHVYVVGGAVRNWVIDKPIKDIDVMIDSVVLDGRDSGWFAEQLQKAIPAETNWTTNQYGVAILTVKSEWIVGGEDLNGEIIEIANARKESYGGVGGKGYKPHMVEPSTVEEDVVRREFTFNCMAGSTLIPTEKGILRIDEIADRGQGNQQGIRLDVAGKEGLSTAVGWQYSGYAPTLRVTTEWGHSFECTHHHPVLVLRGHAHEWVQADQLEKGDLLCVPVHPVTRKDPLPLKLSDPEQPRHGTLKEVRKPEVMTPELAYVIGCVVSEGSNTHKTVSFSNSDEAFISRYMECFHAVFGFYPSRNKVVEKGTVRVLGGVEFIANQDGFDIYANSRTVVDWLSDLGLYCGGAQNGKSASHHKVVPWSILQADEVSQRAFLAAYLEGDGSIRPDTGRIVYCSSSPHIRQQLQIMLGSHGILSRVASKSVHINAVDSALLWEMIHPWMVTKEFDYSTREFKSRNRYGIPKDYLQVFLRKRRVRLGSNQGPSLYRTDGNSEVAVRGLLEPLRRPKRILYDAHERGDFEDFLSKLELVSPSEHERLVKLLSLRYQYVGVSSVEGAGEQDVYDLSMGEEVEPAFVANGVVVHNTLMWRLSELASGPDKAEIVDITGCGLDDLKSGIMRCPSDPDKTFSDDPTRMIRAVKFLTKYGFKIDGEVRKSIQRNARKIKNVPQNAVATLLMEDVLKEKTGVKAVMEMRDLGLLDPLAEMIAESKPFRATLVNWSREKPLRFLYDIIDVGFPLDVSLGFLPRKADQRRFKELVYLLSPDEGQELYAALKQPGKAWKDKKFLRDLAVRHDVQGKGMGPFAQAVQIVTRDLLLAEPGLLHSPRELRDRVRQELEGGWSSKRARVPLPKGQWVDADSSKLDRLQKSEVWEIFSSSYAGVGLPVSSVSQLLSEFKLLWLTDIDGDEEIDAFIGYKKRAGGRKLAVMGTDGSSRAKKAVFSKAKRLLSTSGWYTEASHKPAALLESMGFKPIDDEQIVRSALAGKDIEWKGDGLYSRNIKGVGTVDKKMYGKPRVAAKQAATYKNKKKVKTENGDTKTVYEYSDRQKVLRKKDKAERVEKLRKNIGDLRFKYKSDLKSKDDRTRLTALAVALIDETYERVGNEESASDGHFGVTGWQANHITFSNGKAIIKYTGKSGVKQEKEVTSKPVVEALKKVLDGKSGEDCVFHFDDGKVSSSQVNDYLGKYEVTAKDLRGLHANKEMCRKLDEVRKGKKLPDDKKEREELLKEEFEKALEEAAAAVGHEPATLRSHYLVPGLEEAYLKDGSIVKKMKQATIAERVARQWVTACGSARDWIDIRIGSFEEERQSILDWIDSHGPKIRLYREVLVDDLSDLRLADLGVSWTSERTKAVSPFGRVDRSGSRKIVLQAVVDRDSVDEFGTVAAMRRHPAEEEIRILPGSSVRLEGYWEDGSFSQWKAKGKAASSRIGTKSPSDKEDETAEKLVKPAPKKKPPRYDLRNRRRSPEGDKDLEGTGAEEDRDMSLNYKRVAMAIRVAADFASTEKGAKKLHERYMDEHPDSQKDWQEFYRPPDEKHEEPPEEEEEFDSEADKKRREEEQDKAVRKEFSTALSGLKSLPDGFKEQVEVLTEGMSEEDAQAVADAYIAQRQKLIGSSDEWSEKDIDSFRESMNDFPKKGSDPKDIGEQVAKALYAKNIVFNPMRSGGKAIDDTDMGPSELRFRAEASFQNWKGMKPDERASAASDLRKVIKDKGEDSPEGKQAAALLDGVKLAALVSGDRDEDGSIPAWGDEPEPSYKFQQMAKALANLPEGRKVLFSSVEDMSKPNSGTRAVMQRALSSLDDETFARTMGGGPDVPESDKSRLVKQFESGDLSGRDKDRLRQLMVNMALDDMMLLHYVVRDTMGDDEDDESRRRRKRRDEGDAADSEAGAKDPTPEEVEKEIRERESAGDLERLQDAFLQAPSEAEKERIEEEIRLKRMELMMKDCETGDSEACAILQAVTDSGDPSGTDLKTDPPLR